jgi:hypothetical protein
VLLAATFSLSSAAAVAEQDVAVELYFDGAWNAAPTYTADGIACSRGAPGEGQEAPPSSASLVLDDHSGDYSPRNPVSPLYGLVGRNTPCRISVGGDVRSCTEVSSWAPEVGLGGVVPRVAIEGGGILRRLQQGNTPLKSALYRAIQSADVQPSYWWSLEGGDGQAVTSVPSTLTGGPALTAAPASAGGSDDHRLSGVVGGSVVGPLGGSTALDLSGGGQLSVGLPDMFLSAAGPLRVEVAVLFTEPVDPLESGQILRLSWLDVIVGLFQVPDGDVSLDLSDTGSFVSDTAAVVLDDGQWHHIRLDLTYAGVDTDYEVTVDGVSVMSGTAASVAYNQPETLVLAPTGDVDAAAHLAIWDGSVPTNVDTAEAFAGYAGELAGTRFLRLCAEEGVDATVLGDDEDTQPMGPQVPLKLVDLIRECSTTDDGMLFEPRASLGLTLKTGRDRYNQDPVLTLDFADKGIAPGIRPVFDDQNTRNDVTAQRRNGASARAVQETGPMNVQNPIDDPEGVGRYDTTVDVNTATDAALLDHATWHLHKGTVEDTRYPSITIDLDAAPELVADVNALEHGDIIEVENLPAGWSPSAVRLIVLGVREQIGSRRRLVTLNCAPASTFEIGIVGANDGSTDLRGQAVGTDRSSLASGVTAYVTTLSVATTGGGLWTTDADDWNTSLNGGGLYITVGGEEMRVTNISGASSPQTFTVVRSTNGVVKSHGSGAAVQLRNPIRVGL